ncbi:RES family NAD+ phosphorylase [Candidatus Pantoea multigeneris]
MSVPLIQPASLSGYFEFLINIYEIDHTGQSLVECLKQDWMLFQHSKMDNAHVKELLSDILDNGEIVRKSFSPSKKYESHALAEWDTLRDELLHKNRYFLEGNIDQARLKKLLGYLVISNLQPTWHRARINQTREGYALSEMGAPPNMLASHGRANPTGIPYLYLGSSSEAAISEIRPHTGETATVAEFLIKEKIKLVDLRSPRKSISPFLLPTEDDIGRVRADIPFLERLGEELTRPVLPRSAAIDYIPSQYLCEFIKKSGFDGVVYRSSVSDGINLALFNPDNAHAICVSQFSVHRVSVSVASLGPVE